MYLILAHFSVPQMLNALLILILLFLGYRYLETFWSYKISKPFGWEDAVKNKRVSNELKKFERSYRDRVRFYNLWFQVSQLKKNNVPGAFAELGVHQGKTARAIHLMDEDRTFYLLDTFEGFKEKDLAQESQTDGRFSTTMFDDTSIDRVRDYLGGSQNLHFKPGFFPDTSEGLENEDFALVHIDADLYAPTSEALKFFYPRLNKGGVMIIHDYNHNWDGVKKAIDEFMPTIPESLIELPDWQGSVMIVKNSCNRIK